MPRRHLNRRKKRTLLAAAVAFPLVAGAILLGLYLRLRVQPLSAGERRQIAGRFKAAIEGAGGSQVWVKEPPYAPFPPIRADLPAEVLITAGTYDAVLATIRNEAQKQDLQIAIKATRTREHYRVADVRLTRGREPASRWRLREVNRLRHAAIVIDDLGQDLEAARHLLALPYPITFSVLPHLRHSLTTAEEVHRAGREVMLHLPMEPDSPTPAGQGEIRVGMSAREIERIIQENLTSVPYAVGVNNHMGSRATASARLMEKVIDVLAERHLYFVDSRTTGDSVAFDLARQKGLATFYRAVFLDDTPTTAYALAQLREFRRLIEAQGAALAIGHPYPTTIAALSRFLPELEKGDIQLLPASQLLQLPEVARLAPPHNAAGPY